MITMAILRYAL